MADPLEPKRCTMCGEAKAPGNFPKRITGRSASWCKACTSAATAARRREKVASDPAYAERLRDAQRASRSTEGYRAKRAEYRSQPAVQERERAAGRGYDRDRRADPGKAEAIRSRDRERSRLKNQAAGPSKQALRRQAIEAEVEQGVRTCTKCGEVKPTSEHAKRKKAGGILGYASWCKPCMRQMMSERHAALKQDPKYAAKLRERDRLRYEAIKADPEKLEKERARSRTYAAQPGVRERMEERIKQWAKDNPERVAENRRLWLLENPGKNTEYGKKYRERNRTKYLDNHANNQHMRRWRLVNQGGDFTGRHAKLVHAFWGYQCAYCGSTVEPGPRLFALDHVVPLSKGGAHSPGNIVACCKPCNDKKNARMIPPEFMAKIVPQLEAFVAALPEESFFGGMGHPRTVEYACWDAEQRLRGKGVPIGVWW